MANSKNTGTATPPATTDEQPQSEAPDSGPGFGARNVTTEETDQ